MIDYISTHGFRAFPLVHNTKIPLIKNYEAKATNDLATLKSWLTEGYNLGIVTTALADGSPLVVLDVDVKNGKEGLSTLKKIMPEGNSLPSTFWQKTPTGGYHIFFKAPYKIKQGTNVLGPGLDIRAAGGYVVAAGSQINGSSYTYRNSPIQDCPDWLLDKLEKKDEVTNAEPDFISEHPSDLQRATAYAKTALPSIEGNGGDDTAFKVCAAIKDFGVSPSVAFVLLSKHWNNRCLPPWSDDELVQKISNAYEYGTKSQGAISVEKDFTPLNIPGKSDDNLHPVNRLNKQYALVLSGGGHHIVWETVDHNGRYKVEHLSEGAFHTHLAHELFQAGNKAVPLTKVWISSPDRRTYDGICFRPGLKTPERFFNMWRGFNCKPLEGEPDNNQNEALRLFREHLLDNVCNGDASLAHWLTGYLAHSFQRPWEKPLVALVFRGAKGVGKNALIERVGWLHGSNYLLASNKRYLVSNFNGHLENNILFVLDEAFWSGDKQAEGVLKDLITGSHHFIERKGKEGYKIDNCSRVVIIGNEDWLVPASNDERRFAVFDVGEGRKQDTEYFRRMRDLMEGGGYSYLLKFFLEYDVTDLNFNSAPLTAGLIDQKNATLEPLHEWWLDSLSTGAICGLDTETEWSKRIAADGLRIAYTAYIKQRNIKTRIGTTITFLKKLKTICPAIHKSFLKNSVHNGKWVVDLPPLSEARSQWESFIGHAIEWH